MNTFKSIVIAAAIITSSLQLFAQDQFEALLFSQRFPQSDARAMGAGNAFGAVGSNLICSSINPGSLALYKKSEFSFSLGFLSINNNSNYLGNLSSDHRYALMLPQIGLAINIPNSKNGEEVKDGWVSFNLSGSVNRMNSFQSNRYFEGLNQKSSILYNYAEMANGTYYKNLSLNNVGGLAWDTYLIDTISKNPNQNTYIPIDTISRDFFQQNSIKTRGSNYDINFAFAGNYSDKVFIGVALSIPSIKYTESRDFTETNKYTNPSSYLSSDYSRELDVNGTGLAVSFGIVIKPIKYIRIGGSIQSPTYYNLTGTYNQKMRSNLVGGQSYSQSSQGEMEFNFTSPFRATGSLAIIAGKYGFLGVDYEFVDYSQGYYSTNSNYQYIAENNRIESYYTATSNLRIGGELKFDIFALRGGYGMYGSPFKSVTAPVGADASAKSLSFGLGMREKNYFIDFAFQQMQTKEFYLPYSLNQNTMDKYKVSEVSGNIDDLKKNTFLLTFGVKF